MNREAHITSITRILATLRAEVELRNSINLTDLNIHAENFYRDLFNMVYGLGLGNMNFRRQNEAYIDLIDEKNKIAIQVTSDHSAGKISKTIEGFFSDNSNKSYRLKVLLIAKQAKDYRKDFTFEGKYEFSPEKDVVDIEKLLNDIADKEIDQLELIANYLGKNLGNSYAGTRGMLVGADRIDTAFIERIEKGEKFSRARFYTGDQESYCQWYGVHNGYDVSRDAYPAVRAAVLDSFGYYSRYKVAAIIHGSGGCGKSTLLRRLALDLARESDIKVFWVLNTQIEEFSERALQEIQSDLSSNYLIFVEDWYRIDPNDKLLVEKIIRESQEVSNIRIVVGDRDPEGKVYWDNLPVKENAFELKPDENPRIIDDILEWHPDWKQAAWEALANENSYNSALFLILFVLAGISEGRFEKNEVNFHDLKTTAQAIARYDLRTIAGVYPGLAKALFYWSCVYAAYHIFITYDAFLKIADNFNENDDPSRYLANWDADDKELKRLQLYVNVGVNVNLATRYKSLNLIQLNHDKVAEEVISKLSIPGWLPYNDTTKRILLNVLVDKGDSYSASIVASRFLLNETRLFKNESDEKSLIDKLFFEKKNRNLQYLRRLRRLNLTASDLFQYIDILMKEDLYPLILWSGYFERANIQEKEKAAKSILDREDPTSLPPHIVVAAFNQPGNQEEKEKAAKCILDREDLTSLRYDFVVAAFNQPGNQEEKDKAAKSILDREDLTSLPPHIVIAAFNHQGNQEEKEKAAKCILDCGDLTSLPHNIVIAAFNQPGNQEEKEKAAKSILDREDMTSLLPHIVVAAFNQPGNQEEKEKAAKSILDREDPTSLPYDFVVAAFNQPGNQEEKDKAAKCILDREDPTALRYEFVVAAFNQPGNQEEKEKAAKSILDREDLTSLPHNIVVAAFNQPGNQEEKEKAAKSILDREDLTSLPPHIVVAAFNQSGNQEEKEKAAKSILEDKNIGSLSRGDVVKATKFIDSETLRIKTLGGYLSDWRALNRDLVYSSLYSFSRVKDVPDFVTRIVEEIIRDYSNRSNQTRLKHFWFYLILKIPFHQVPAWKRASSYAIKAWKQLPRKLVVNLILSHRTYPDEIEVMCEDILDEWEWEIERQIMQLFDRSDHFGDHVRMAMGHPALRAHAAVAARQMIIRAEKESGSLPDYLLNVAKNIVEKAEYPAWESGD